jgi:hypothetical protein
VVFACDVVDAIIACLNRTDDSQLVLNIACAEKPTLYEFVHAVVGRVSPGASLVTVSEDDVETCDYYPSVSCGPLAISAATETVGWRPTPLEEVVLRTVSFFRQAQLIGLREFWAAAKKLPPHVRERMKGALGISGTICEPSGSSSDTASSVSE